jgi:hypothetical protein
MGGCQTGIGRSLEYSAGQVIDTLDQRVQQGTHQVNYINALAVSVSPFFEPAKVTLGGLFFSPWVDFL